MRSDESRWWTSTSFSHRILFGKFVCMLLASCANTAMCSAICLLRDALRPVWRGQTPGGPIFMGSDADTKSDLSSLSHTKFLGSTSWILVDCHQMETTADFLRTRSTFSWRQPRPHAVRWNNCIRSDDQLVFAQMKAVIERTKNGCKFTNWLGANSPKASR